MDPTDVLLVLVILAGLLQLNVELDVLLCLAVVLEYKNFG
jgi:hypothetical protein